MGLLSVFLLGPCTVILRSMIAVSTQSPSIPAGAVMATWRHQAHSKDWPNYGQMNGRSLCLRTKPGVTQLVFKWSSQPQRQKTRWEGGGDQLVINIYLVSYWKENLQFVRSRVVQVVGHCRILQEVRERERERNNSLPHKTNITFIFLNCEINHQ